MLGTLSERLEPKIDWQKKAAIPAARVFRPRPLMFWMPPNSTLMREWMEAMNMPSSTPQRTPIQGLLE